MPDPADLAQLVIERNHSIRERDGQRAAGLANKKASVDCFICGELIPEDRQVATGGTNSCVSCQSDLEHKSRFSR